jgi:hypothetical protein
MTDISTAYDKITDQINTYISTQVSSSTSWDEVAGGLSKVVASSIGFAWGVKSDGTLWTCQLPCNGSWKEVKSPIHAITDVATDDVNVYVLGDNLLCTKSANGSTDWVSTKAPPDIKSLFVTNSYIWSQTSDYSTKYKLAKPGTTGNWIKVPDAQKIHILSASSNALYGIDNSGRAMKTDESLQSKWAGVPALAGAKYQNVIGTADQTAIYGVNVSNELLRCTDSSCSPVSTGGRSPENITVEPTSKQVWMTTTSPGTVGNIFMKQDTPDYSSILNTVTPLDKQRDDLAVQGQKEFQQTAETNTLQDKLDMISAFLTTTLKVKKPNKKLIKDKTGKARDAVTQAEAELGQLQQSIPLLEQVVILLLITVAIYLIFFWVFGWFTHVIAFLNLLGGILYIIYISPPKQ